MLAIPTSTPVRRHGSAVRSALALLALILAAGTTPVLRAQEGEAPRSDDESGAVPLPPAGEILAEMIVAEGGREAMAKVRSRVIRGEFSMPMGVTAQFTSFNDGEGNHRETMRVAGPGQPTAMVFERGITNGVAWSEDTVQGARILDGVEADLARRTSHLHLLLHVDTDYVGMECTGRKTIHERPCYEMKMTPAIGNPETWYVDAENHLNVRTEMVVEAPMVGKVRAATDAFDWREVDGLRLPHRMEVRQGPQRFVFTISSYEHNVDIPVETFRLPDAVQALLDKQGEKDGEKEGGAKPPTDPAPAPPPKEGEEPKDGDNP